MNQIKSKIKFLIAFGFVFSACGKSYQAVKPATEGGSQATTGALYLPNVTCGSANCVNKLASRDIYGSTASKELVYAYTAELYILFSETMIPALNQVLHAFDQAAITNGYSTCSSLTALTNQTNLSLGSGYTVDILTGTKTIPSPMTNSGSTMSKKLILYANSTAFAHIELYCNSSTQKTMYVRLYSSSKAYEIFSQADGSSKTIFAAYDSGGALYSLYFKTTDGQSAEIHAVAESMATNNTTLSFASAAGMNLGTAVADIGIVVSGNSTLPTSLTSASDNSVVWSSSPTNIRHCYSNYYNQTLTTSASSCTGLLSAAPSVSGVIRSAATDWTIDGMNSSISTTF